MLGRRGRGLLAGLALALGVWLPVTAQEVLRVPSPILTLDQEQLFSQSRAADEISAAIEAEAAELAAENREIEAALTAEELELTELRPTLDPDEFRALADAFDVKVQGLRAEQDAKALDLQRRRDEERQTFLRQITPVLAEIVRERGAVVVLDRRSVFLSAETIDITEEAVARINAAFEANAGEDDSADPGAADPEAVDPGGTDSDVTDGEEPPRQEP
ncbi:MAG: OmpH family outer membrane protein [Rhodobacter sp.]|nr:OmpH family outer membrane protein [Rhodobacter sp.]